MQDKREIILELQRLRREQGLTYQDLVSQCEAHGEAVSLSTVKRVFAKGGENGDYRFETTIKPLVRVLKGLEHSGTELHEEPHSGLMEALLAEKDRANRELSISLGWYRQTLAASRRRERVLLLVLLVLAVALYGMIDYFVFPTSLLFRPGL